MFKMQELQKKVVSIILVLAAMANGLSAAEEHKQKPNILFIFADDWGWADLSCHGHPYVKTPNIDRLAAEGTDFYRFTVASGVCSPSRTAVMTGHFPARYGIDGHFAWPKDNAKRNMPDWLALDAPFFPRWFQRAGYATAHYGKWHISNNMIPDSPVPGEYGFDDYGAFNCSGEQMPVHDDAARAISFIEQSHKEGKPFYINLWVHEPHTPFHVVPKYQQRFPELDEVDNIYAATLAHADDRIGQVLNVLDRLGIAENTLVIFSSDNGPARSKPGASLGMKYDSATGVGYNTGAAKGITGGRKGYKASLFEGGIGVPFLVRWPGKIAAGEVENKSLISAVDLLPTFCEIAGVSLPEDYTPDGVSQVKALLGTPSGLRDKPLFWKFNAKWPPSKSNKNHWASYVVVYQSWKLLVNHDGTHAELYNLIEDPYEKNDQKEVEPEVSEDLLNRLEEWKATLPLKPEGDVFSKHRN